MYLTAPEDMGQMVTESWEVLEDGMICRTYDSSDRTESFTFHRYQKNDAQEFCIANGSPISQGVVVRRGKKITPEKAASLIARG